MNVTLDDVIKKPVPPEFWLIVLAMLTASTVWIFTYWSVEQDRELTRSSSFQVSQSIALSLEEHVTETLRDASNSLVSAALAIEQSGGLRKFSVAALQRELDRELPDKTSVKRLVVLDRDANAVATSDVRQLPSIRVPHREFYQWHLAHPTDTSVHLSQTIRTTVQKEWVIPLSRAIIVDGRFEGIIVAQLDILYFEAFYRKLAALYPATLGLAHENGRVMFLYPFNDSFMNRDLTTRMDWAQTRKGPGTIEHLHTLDGRPRFVSHRSLAGIPLVVLVGIDAENMMAPWRERTLQRSVAVGVASLVFFALLWALVAFLRWLARSEARFRRLYDGANDGIIVIRDERIIDVNPAGLAMLGYSRAAEMIGRLPTDFYPPQPPDAPAVTTVFRQRLERVLAGELPRYEMVLAHKDGREIAVEASMSAIKDSDETLVMSMFRDVTERKRAESELKLLAAELEERVEQRTAQLSATLRELESFSYTVSHDLRAPLRHMRSYSTTILQDFAGELPPECVRMLGRIDAAGERMDALIVALLALSKVSWEDMAITRCNLSAIAYSTIATLRELDPDRAVTVEIEPNLEVQADRGMLEALLGNLLDNAWKFTAKAVSPGIAVGSTQRWGRQAFFVRDNGVGFDMAHAAHLFEPFHRLHDASEFPGTGIGLATVHRIVERHGGKIEAESAPEKGTCFYFTLAAGTRPN